MSSDSTPGSSGGNSPDKNRRLRRPHAATQERLRNGEFDQNSNNPPVMKSKLSVDAPVFIPKFTVAPQTNDGLYQDFQRLVSIRPSHLSGVTTAGTAGKDSPADMFKDAVFQLTSNPGPMEEYLKPIVDLLKRGVTDMAVLHEIIDTLFEQSISEVNFRFTGAKICKYLSNELKSHHVFSNFRGLYLNKCKEEFDKRDDLLESNLDRLCGLSMYFGELFLVLEIETNGTVIKIGLLRKAISDLIRTLLSRLDDVTLKCAAQLIKLTGPALMETKDLGGNFDDIFDIIKTLEKHPSLNKTSHCLVNSVLSRLEYNFGVNEQTSPQKPVSQQNMYSSPNFNNEPIFYNSQGQPISREEAGFSAEDSDFEGLNREEQEAFLQWEAENIANQQQWGNECADNYPGQQQWIDQGGDNFMQQQWSSGESSYTEWSSSQDQNFGYEGGELYSESDMDEEMAAAYEIFLRESQQQ